MVILVSKNKLDLREKLSEVFHSGIKNSSDFKIGVEVEKLPVKNKIFRAVSYYEKGGIKDFLSEFASQDGWQPVKLGGNTIALKKDGHDITLEPGSQFEVSLPPQDNIHSCADYLASYHSKTAQLAQEMGFCWLGYGVQPVSTYSDIDVIPKPRYALMGEYLPRKASCPLVMMRETAGTQVALDYGSEEDAIRKLRLGVMLAPYISALFSNSPVRDSSITGFKSYRAHSWLNTDPDRCGLISSKLFDADYEFGFQDYVDTVLDIPMIFVERNGVPLPIVNRTFRQYLQDGYEGLEATIEDWNLHSSLFFPDVRMKNFIEFRNADCQNLELSLAIMAFYKGVFYDEQAIAEAYKEIGRVNWDSINMLRQLTPKYGIDFDFRGRKISGTVFNLLSIANQGLIRQGKGEEVFLRPALELAKLGKTPADILLDVYDGNISSLVEFCKIL